MKIIGLKGSVLLGIQQASWALRLGKSESSQWIKLLAKTQAAHSNLFFWMCLF
jgi:hypothetical protein